MPSRCVTTARLAASAAQTWSARPWMATSRTVAPAGEVLGLAEVPDGGAAVAHHLPRVGTAGADEQLQQGGLAVAVASDDADDVTVVEAERDPVEDRARAERERDAFGVDQVRQAQRPRMARLAPFMDGSGPRGIGTLGRAASSARRRALTSVTWLGSSFFGQLLQVLGQLGQRHLALAVTHQDAGHGDAVGHLLVLLGLAGQQGLHARRRTLADQDDAARADGAVHDVELARGGDRPGCRTTSSCRASTARPRPSRAGRRSGRRWPSSPGRACTHRAAVRPPVTPRIEPHPPRRQAGCRRMMTSTTTAKKAPSSHQFSCGSASAVTL